MRELGRIVGFLAAVATACVGDTNETTDAGSDATVDAPSIDAGGDVDAGGSKDAEAGAPCNLQADFGAPVHISELSTSGDDVGLRLSPDELTAWFSSSHLDDGGVGDWSTARLYVATRATLQSAWSQPALVQMTSVSSIAGPATDPSITADGLTAIFEGYIGGQGQSDLYVSSRSNTSAIWGAPGLAASINQPTSNEITAYWVSSGNKLYFASDRGTPPYYDMFTAVHTAGFSSPAPLTELNTVGASDYFPVVSNDELTIYWSSGRKDLGGAGDEDIYVATRAATTDAFSNIKRLTTLSDSNRDEPTWISPDGCRLYIASIRTGGFGARDFYIASRP